VKIKEEEIKEGKGIAKKSESLAHRYRMRKEYKGIPFYLPEHDFEGKKQYIEFMKTGKITTLDEMQYSELQTEVTKDWGIQKWVAGKRSYPEKFEADEFPPPDQESAQQPIIDFYFPYPSHLRRDRKKETPLFDRISLAQVYKEGKGIHCVRDGRIISSLFSRGKGKWAMTDGKGNTRAHFHSIANFENGKRR